jgi:type IV secretory pathway VirB4 component
MNFTQTAKPLGDDLEIWGFEENTILFDDGSLGFGFKLQPLDIQCFSAASTNDLKSRLSLFLNGIPAGTDLQFIAEVGFENKETLRAHENLISEQAKTPIRKLTLERLAGLREEDAAHLIPRHSLYLVVRRKMRGKLVDQSFLPKIMPSQKRYESIVEAKLKRELHEVSQVCETISSSLSQLGFDPRPLTPKDCLHLIHDQWNPKGRADFSSDHVDPDALKQSLTYTDIGILPRGFLIGDVKHRVVSLKHFPDPTYSGMAQALSSLPLGSRLFLTIHVPDQTKELESLQTSRRIAFAMARGKRSGVSDLESEAKLQDLETLLEQMIAQGEHVFHASLNIVLRGEDDEKLDTDVQNCLSTIRSLSGAEAMEETLASYFIFRELAIPNARAKERAKKIKTSNLSDLLPVYGPWEGMSSPRVLLRSLDGGLFRLDPFSPELTNANQLISGAAGAGKSFFTNILILHMLKECPKVFFVDIGGSYKKLCENLGGSYIPLGLNSGISINPFDLAESEMVPSPEKIKFLLGLVELMTKEDDNARLSRLERACVESAIQVLYQNTKTPRLSDLKALLCEDPMPEIQKIGKILSGWVGASPFGQFVDQPTTISWKGDLTAFDLKGLESYPELQAVCLFMITDLVWREIQRDRSTMKFLVFDECWKLLKSESGLVFIEEVFRTFRKYRASAIAISQALDDFAKSKIANAILPNCSMKWLLMQPEVDAERLVQVLNLNPMEIERVKSLHQERGVYSQAFLIAEKNRSVVVTESLPLEYWIATTDPRDLGVIEKCESETPALSRIETILKLSQTYPRGVAAFEKENR